MREGLASLLERSEFEVVGQAGEPDELLSLVREHKPELVVVVESPVAEVRMREMFNAVDGLLRENPEVGGYNQTI